MTGDNKATKRSIGSIDALILDNCLVILPVRFRCSGGGNDTEIEVFRIAGHKLLCNLDGVLCIDANPCSRKFINTDHGDGSEEIDTCTTYARVHTGRHPTYG